MEQNKPILIMSSSFTFFEIDSKTMKKIPTIIDNQNNFLENLKKLLTKRDVCLIISGNPKKERLDPTKINREGFEMSGIGFKKYIYLDDSNKHFVKDYIKIADCIDLCGGNLPTCNAFANELNLKELLKDYRDVIIGASGGAMNLADNVYCKPELEEEINKNFNKHLKGCALTNINIIPHFDKIRFKNLCGLNIVNDILLPDSKDTPLLALNDGSYIIQINDDKYLYGEAYIINREIYKVNINDSVIKFNSIEDLKVIE